MTELDLWVKMGTSRKTALAKELECSVSNVTQLCKSTKCKSIERVRQAIVSIEKKEMRLERCCKNNMLGAARFMDYPVEWVRETAKFNLLSWSEIYAKHC